MKTLVQILVLSTVFCLSAAVVGPSNAQADDYWTNHWNWYDNTYQPYYYRSYRPSYGYYSGPGYYQAPGYYGPGYYSAPGYSTYGYSPYRSYYGAPGVGYGRTYGGGQAVRVGPMSFGWR